MVGLEPLTAGFDWEVGVYQPGLCGADEAAVERLAERLLKAHPAATTGREWRYVEQRSGIMHSFDEVLERATAMLDLAHAAAAEEKLRLGPVGMMANLAEILGCHVHVGCLYSFHERQRLSIALLRYLPAFVALACHSPFCAGRVGEYKSYRATSAWDVGPISPGPADAAIEGMWGDLCSDRGRKPTIEVRVADSPGSARFVAEYVAFLAGFLATLAESDELAEAPRRLPHELVDTVDNRCAAARHGLQATFVHDGAEVPVSDLLALMLERARPGLGRFGTAPEALTLVRRMLAQRQTQADLLLALVGLQSDPLCYVESCLQVLRRPTAFEDYLATAPALPVVPRESRDELLWECIGERTHIDAIRHTLRWPPAAIEARLEAWQEEGRVTIETCPLVGYVVSRSG